MDTILGEIRAFGGNFAPQNWLFCDGSLLSITSYQTLFALIGSTYGGNGSSNFALPDLRGRLAVGQGQGQNPTLTQRIIGSHGGTEEVTLVPDNLPVHSHAVKVSTVTAGSIGKPASSTYLGSLNTTTGQAVGYLPGATPSIVQKTLGVSTIQNSGGNQPHENIMPCLAINYIICVNGIFPQQPS